MYLPAAHLRRVLDEGQLLTTERVITYCGSGIAASSVAFALALLGHENVAIYDGSLVEWRADPTLPLIKHDLAVA